MIPYARADHGHSDWCYPTVSYHHLSPDMIEDLWKFEQQWLGERDNVRTSFHLYLPSSLWVYG